MARMKPSDDWDVVDDGATRIDGVMIRRDPNFFRFAVSHPDGKQLMQRTRSGEPRPRLFKYLDSAIHAADTAWPTSDARIDAHIEAFRLVADVEDWRKPIDAVVPADRLVAVVDAIHYFTATATTVAPEGDGQFRVTAIGYRQGPAGEGDGT